MRLVNDWRRVIRKAWSLRLLALAGVLSAIEVALPYLDGVVSIPPRLLAATAGIVTALAFVARLMAQRSMADGNTPD